MERRWDADGTQMPKKTTILYQTMRSEIDERTSAEMNVATGFRWIISSVTIGDGTLKISLECRWNLSGTSIASNGTSIEAFFTKKRSREFKPKMPER